jgi:hypothetical protein
VITSALLLNMKMSLTSPLSYGLCAALALLPQLISAQAPQAQLPQIPADQGEWITFPTDGTVWGHRESGLHFPAELANFKLTTGFQAKKAEDGTALTYMHPKQGVKADILLTPCPKELSRTLNIMPVVEETLRQMGREFRQIAPNQGYMEDEEARGSIEKGSLELWKVGSIPVVQGKMEMKAKDPATAETTHPNVNQWLFVTLYQDVFVQASVIMPSKLAVEGERLRQEFVTALIALIREPALADDFIQQCADYGNDPFTEVNRTAADKLLAFSRESPVFEITFPGEALTPVLDEINNLAPGGQNDVLRGYIIGAGIKSLTHQTIDVRFEEGIRMMVIVYAALQAKDKTFKAPLMEELTKLSAEKKGADWLRKRMNAPVAK